jgi:hypothetical protein
MRFAAEIAGGGLRANDSTLNPRKTMTNLATALRG